MLLVFKVGSRIDKAQTNYVANWLANKLEFLILGGRWESVRLISDSFNGAECKRMTQLDVKIGGWLAYKNRDGIEQIKTEVSGWDVSGLDERYFVIKKLLLNMLTEEELANAIENELFTQFEVFTHPLFADIGSRTHLEWPRMRHLKNRRMRHLKHLVIHDFILRAWRPVHRSDGDDDSIQ